jgi:alpha-galactosidase
MKRAALALRPTITRMLVLGTTTAKAPCIRFDEATMSFRLDAREVTYAFGVNRQGQLQSLYWGARLADGDAIPPGDTTSKEYAGWGGRAFAEADLKIDFPDGSRDLLLSYISHRLEDEALIVHMRDIRQTLDVDLHYAIDPDTGIVARSATVRNRGNRIVIVRQASAGSWNLPAGDDYSLRYLSVDWQLRTRPVEPGETALESHGSHPWFAIARGDAWPEESGEVWFGALASSGSWRISIGQDVSHQVRIAGGHHPFDFAHRLKSGESLQTPVFLGGYTTRGIGEASRLSHRSQIAKVRPVLYNSREEADQLQLADRASAIGVECFVVDSEQVAQELGPLIAHVTSLGMTFGLRVDPEAVIADGEPCHVLASLDKLLTNNDIRLLKWDNHRNGSVRHRDRVLHELRRRHPHVEIESCTASDSRVDRLAMHDGFSYANAPAAITAWVTDSSNGADDRATSLDYRFLSAMQASIGIDANLSSWTIEEQDTARRYVNEYKTIRATVQQGRLYRLISPRDGSPFTATVSVAEDGKQAVLFAFLQTSRTALPFPRLRMKGLEANVSYRFRLLHGKLAEGTPEIASGAYWMNRGIAVVMRGHDQGTAVVFERMKGKVKS